MNRSDAATQILVDRGAELADQLERAIRWAVHLEGENAKLTDARDQFARFYGRSIERFGHLGIGVMQKIADGGTLRDVLDFVGDTLAEVDHVDDESLALWQRAAEAIGGEPS